MHSLGQALEKLGYGPCYNTNEVFRNPDYTGVWKAALDDKPVDWGLLFAAYRSAVKWPMDTFLPERISG